MTITALATPSDASPFDALRREDERGEYWSARELAEPLGYTWRGFTDAIARGRVALRVNGQDPDEQIRSWKTPSKINRGGPRADYRMTREGVYATIQGGDPRKPAIAAAWAYFRVRTRQAESIEEVKLTSSEMILAKLHRVPMRDARGSGLGRTLASLYRQRFSEDPPSTRDERYGKVFLYPLTLLDEVFCRAGAAVTYVIGIDPGPITGIMRLELDCDGHPAKLVSIDVLQVTHGLLDDTLETLASNRPTVAIERFVVGPRAARSSTAKAGATARSIITQIQTWATQAEFLPYFERSAAEVKPWATDERLAAAGLIGPTKGMRHARDAARHALFCAVKDYGLPDPLSVRSGR